MSVSTHGVGDSGNRLSTKVQLNIAIGILLTLVISFLSYSPGLLGNFFTLDDGPTLSLMNTYGDMDSIKKVEHYAFSGSTGPSGRPLALLSFLINDDQWPGSPTSFRYTNLLFHLFTGILIFLLSRKILLIYTPEQPSRANYFSLAVMAIWLLHPLNTSTVLYIVQRMTILASAITIAGLLLYLKIRLRVANYRPIVAGSLLLSVVTAFTLLGILAKEIAALLPLYIVVIEFCFHNKLPKLPSQVKVTASIFSIIFFFLAVAFISKNFDRLLNAYDFRDFSLTDRVLAQPYILFRYLSNIIVPRPFGISIFHDDAVQYLENTPLLALSFFCLFILVVLSIILRRKFPVLSFGLLWFIVGHSIESSVLPLELYFEHRNYLPMFGVLFALVYYLGKLGEFNQSPDNGKAGRIYYFPLIGLVLLSLISNISVSMSWRATVPFYEKAITEHPKSLRAKLVYYTYAKTRNPFPGLADFLLQQATDEHPKHLTPRLYAVELKCDRGLPIENQLEEIARLIETNDYSVDFSSLNSIKSITKKYLKGRCTIDSDTKLLKIVTLLETSRQASVSRKLRAHLAEIETDIMVNRRDLDGAIRALDKLYAAQPTVDALLHKIDLLITAGLLTEAEKTVKHAYITDSNRKTFSPSRKDEINNRERLIQRYRRMLRK